MNNVNGVIGGIDIQDKITQAAIWDEQTEMVYVGAGMGRYHLFRDCHYISNEYMTVTRSEEENGKVPGETRTPCAK